MLALSRFQNTIYMYIVSYEKDKNALSYNAHICTSSVYLCASDIIKISRDFRSIMIPVNNPRVGLCISLHLHSGSIAQRKDKSLLHVVKRDGNILRDRAGRSSAA